MERSEDRPTWREGFAVGWLILWRAGFVATVWWGFLAYFVRDTFNPSVPVLIAISAVLGLAYWAWVVQMALIKRYRGFRLVVLREP